MVERLMTDRWLCGWRVRSALPLADLLPWTGDERPPDIEIRVGEVTIAAADREAPHAHVLGDGTFCFSIPGVAAYAVRDGREIVIKPILDAAAPDVQAFVLGTAFGLLCHQRGLLPLHASCVAVGGHAVAFIGPSGAGKSTLAAAFVQQGYPLLADDVTVVATANGTCVVLPAFPRLKLRSASARALAIPVMRRRLEVRGVEQLHAVAARVFCEDVLRLAAIYCIADSTEGPVLSCRQLKGLDALSRVQREVFRFEFGRRLVGEGAMFASVGQLAAIPIYNLSFPRTFEALETVVADVRRRHEQR